MKLIDTAEQCRRAASAWAGRYVDWPDGCVYGPRDGRAALAELPEQPTQEQVEAILPGWSRPPMCDECDSTGTRPVVQLGDDLDYYESRAAWICGECLRRALALAEASA